MKNDLHLIDCMQFMKDVSDNFYVLAIVDPPYGIKQNAHRENNRSKLAVSKKYHNALWSQDRPDKEYFIELKRVSKNIIIWGGNYFCDLIDLSSSCWLVWDKKTTGNFADCELAFTTFKTAVRKFEFAWNGMIQGYSGNKKEQRIHPTQKPVSLYKWVLSLYAEKGFKIFDTHSGSGSLRVACHDMGFDLDSCEIDEIYYKDNQKRFENHIKQNELFCFDGGSCE